MPRDRLNLFDYESKAREQMPEVMWNMVYHGTGDEVATKRIRPAFESILLRPRALRGSAGGPDTGTTVLGTEIALPVIAAAHARKFDVVPDGELATARGTAAAGTLMLIPHLSTYRDGIESYRAAAPEGRFWFQLYVLEDRGATKDAVARAEAAGCSAVVLTISGPPTREIERPVFTSGGRLSAYRTEHLSEVTLRPDIYKEFAIDTSIGWDIVDTLRSWTSLPIVVKGILRRDDAREALARGASGIVVSTHASRLWDGALTSIEALPAIADEVAGRCELYLDSGVRSGIDVLKALALGARACLIGKPLYYGLAVGGEDGVREIFELLGDELAAAMTLCGVRGAREIDASLVAARKAAFLVEDRPTSV